MSLPDFIAEVKTLLGDSGIVTNAADMAGFVTSMRFGHTRPAPAVALPRTVEQVAGLVKLCRKHRVAYVPQGGNTGLVDGGLPNQGGNEVIISLQRMNKIRDIDEDGLIATVEAGVVLQTLRETMAARGLMFPLGIASEGTAEIGGLISTNAGGLAALRYGTMRNLVLGVEAVLPNGEVVSGLRSLAKDNTGYHLASYFTGAEGTLGIVTAATLRVLPLLRQKITSVIAVADIRAALRLLWAFRREAAENLTAFEFMSLNSLKQLMKNVPGARFPSNTQDAPYYVLAELSASSPTMPLGDLFENIMGPALEKGEVLDAILAENQTQAAQFWHAREHIPDALRVEKQRLHFDISLPIKVLADFIDVAGEKIRAVCPDIYLMPFGHLGDGNVHYNMHMPEVRDAMALATLKKQIQDIVFTEVEKFLGSISAEHGVGVERKDILAKLKSPAEMDAMRAVKRAFDPEHLANPGKIFD